MTTSISTNRGNSQTEKVTEMRIFVKNSDGTLAKALTQEQFAVVHDYIVECMNNGRSIKDANIRAMLSEAKLPMDYTVGAEIVQQKVKRR